jgi:uncharacterized protein with PIN domain
MSRRFTTRELAASALRILWNCQRWSKGEIVIEPVTLEPAHLARQAFLDFGKGRHPAEFVDFGKTDVSPAIFA